MPGDPPPPGRRGRGRRLETRFLERNDDRARPLSPPERWRFSVRGQVQGVGYRQACCTRAQELGLAGWVRNRADGSVEVEAEGPPGPLNELRLWCERGPRAAQVSNVTCSQLSLSGGDWFEIRR